MRCQPTLRPGRIWAFCFFFKNSFDLKKKKRILFICWFSCIWFYKYLVVIALAFIYWPRCQWWLRVKHFSDGRLSSFYFAEREKKQWRWKWKKTRTQNVSWLVEAFPWAILWRRSSATALCSLLFWDAITWATPVTSRGTPSEVSIFSQRQRMVITSRDILRRQAGRRAGIAKAKQ